MNSCTEREKNCGKEDDEIRTGPSPRPTAAMAMRPPFLVFCDVDSIKSMRMDLNNDEAVQRAKGAELEPLVALDSTHNDN